MKNHLHFFYGLAGYRCIHLDHVWTTLNCVLKSQCVCRCVEITVQLKKDL